MSLSAFFLNLFYQICLAQHGDIELNPGLNKKLKPLTCCHWDVNSLTAYKIFRWWRYCYRTLQYYPCWSSQQSQKSGVCIYYKEPLAVQFININFLNECLLCEVTFDNKKGYITVLCWSPSQSSSEFDNFLLGFENMLNVISSFKPDFSIILGDFYARPKSWCKIMQTQVKVLKLMLLPHTMAYINWYLNQLIY